jgi:hypothetical protein
VVLVAAAFEVYILAWLFKDSSISFRPAIWFVQAILILCIFGPWYYLPVWLRRRSHLNATIIAANAEVDRIRGEMHWLQVETGRLASELKERSAKP